MKLYKCKKCGELREADMFYFQKVIYVSGNCKVCRNIKFKFNWKERKHRKVKITPELSKKMKEEQILIEEVKTLLIDLKQRNLMAGPVDTLRLISLHAKCLRIKLRKEYSTFEEREMELNQLLFELIEWYKKKIKDL